MEALRRRSGLPEGFRCSAVPLTFFPREKPSSKPYRMNLSLVLLDRATELFGGVFTRNAFPGHPVLIDRGRLANPVIRGILANNRIANVGIEGGGEDAESLLGNLGGLAGCRGEDFFVSSTGVIGWRLPVREMSLALEPLVKGLQRDSVLPVAEAIMTTDSFPKVRSIPVGQGRLVAVAKGAGMIEPNLATMLVFVLTDVSVERGVLRESLMWCAQRSFNCISVDGDQSTSDSLLAISSGVKPPVKDDEFREALSTVCGKLAEDIVRNGEGTGHVMRVTLRGSLDGEAARGAAKAVINSPLVKTAVYGNDPNVGRILNALGDYLGTAGLKVDPRSLSISLGGIGVFSHGAFDLDSEKELKLSGYLEECGLDPSRKGFPVHDRTVDIDIQVGEGEREITVTGSDLSYEYVRENAEYRS
ncbi:MAG TPA: bifunctional ornithine acetyltransferase/N-acetylglutamate synthase [Spirochaetia bacterium]|nr:bifunctional ornithine acetyltransferase/N-acetylglutamate synthase [Spirochaetia bacterium]